MAEQKLLTLTVAIPVELKIELATRAMKTGATYSELVTAALIQYLVKEEE